MILSDLNVGDVFTMNDGDTLMLTDYIKDHQYLCVEVHEGITRLIDPKETIYKVAGPGCLFRSIKWKK